MDKVIEQKIAGHGVFYLLAFLSLLFSLLFLLLHHHPLSICFLLFSLYGFISSSKIRINLSQRKYRKGVHIRNFSLLPWKNFPPNIEYVSVLTINSRSKFKDRYGADATNSYKDYVVNLVYNKRKVLRLIQGKRRAETLHLGGVIAKELGVDLYTVFTEGKKWYAHQDL